MNTFITRTISGIIMIAGFSLLASSNPVIISCVVILLEILVYREIISIRIQESKERNIKGLRLLSWYFLFSTLYYCHGIPFLEWAQKYIQIPSYFFERHNWYSFLLYVAGFCGFVYSLKRKTLKYQIGQFAWTLMTLLLVVVQANYILKNIREAIIWFILPHSLIACNDIWAYFVGILIGKKYIKRPLTPLSPNKSWEGFIGALVVTLIFSFVFSYFLGDIEKFRCSSMQLEKEGGCPPGPLFSNIPLSDIIGEQFSFLYPITNNIKIKRIQLHALIFGLFASSIAPFGGFFASAMKRAYNKKDFNDVIPGHGGFADRLDCHFIMGVFTYVYYITWIKASPINVDELITNILSLPSYERVRIINILNNNQELM